MKATPRLEFERQLRSACAELERRILAGEDGSAEEYLAQLGDASLDEEAVMEIVYTEVVARQEVGEELAHESWYARFPQFRESLERLFEVHSCIDETQPSARTTSIDGSSTDTVTEIPEHLHLGQYELLEEIGRGGMGVVFKARQRGLDRLVALKVVDTFPLTPERLLRFHKEAETIAKLHHPNIVPVFEVGEQGETSFLSMPYYEGGSLEQRLADSPMADRDAAAMIELCARAVQHAHDNDVVHRDLKPANILLSRTGAPKIADFGLAKQLHDVGAEESPMTRAGMVLGTPAYMSPEQAAGELDQVDQRTDIYSLGAILYQSLTGRAPFCGHSPAETLQLVRTQDPVPPRQLQPAVSKDLATICLKCLSKEPARRYSTATELADDLGRFRAGETIRARQVSIAERSLRWCRRRPLVASLLVTLAMVTAGGIAGICWQWHRAELNALEAVKQGQQTGEALKRVVAEQERLNVSYDRARGAVTRIVGLDRVMNDQASAELTRLGALREAVQLYEFLIEHNSSDAKIRLEAARAMMQLGILEQQVRALSAAFKTLTHAEQLLEALHNEKPLYQYRYFASVCAFHRGQVLALSGDPESSRAAFEYAEELQRTQLAASPGNSDSQFRLARTLLHSKVTPYCNQRNFDAAETILAEVRQLHRDSLKRYLVVMDDIQWPLDQQVANRMHSVPVWYLHEVSHADAAQGELLLKQDQPEAAADAFRRSLAIRKWIIDKEPPKTARVQRIVAGPGRLRRIVHRQQTPSSESRQLMAIGHANLARALAAQEDFTAAQIEFDEAANLLEILSAKQAQGPIYRAAWADVEFQRGLMLQEMKDPAAARRAFILAADVFSDLSRRFPEDKAYQKRHEEAKTYIGRVPIRSRLQLDRTKPVKKS